MAPPDPPSHNGLPPSLGTRVHWLTVSTTLPIEAVRRCLLISGDGLAGSEARGRYNHPRHDLTYRGVKAYHGGRAGQRVVLEWDGEACDRTDLDVLRTVWKWLAKNGGEPRCTRIDLARDVGGPSLVRECEALWLDGRYAGAIRQSSNKFHRDGEGGLTFEMGSPSSDVRLVLYDRRGHNRFEFRLRHDHANDAALQLVFAGLDRAYAMAVRRFGSIDAAWWPVVDEPCDDEATPTIRTLSDLQEAIERLRRQMGPTLQALAIAGVTIDELARFPDRISAHQRQQFRLFLDDARREGRSVDEDGASRMLRVWMPTDDTGGDDAKDHTAEDARAER